MQLSRQICAALVLGAGGLVDPGSALAGMPSVDLTDVAKLRLQTISFFACGALAAAWVVQRLWNSLRADFPRMPALTYGRAAAIVGLWGLLFIIVLTMISGARELLTPGAWEKQGLTYRLRSDAAAPVAADPGSDSAAEREQQRERAIRRLQTELLRFAAVHGGRYPTRAEWEALPREMRLIPEHPGVEYRYVPELSADAAGQVLAWEPFVYGDEIALALTANGEITRLTADGLRSLLPDEGVKP
jgi:hypothetical protein